MTLQSKDDLSLLANMNEREIKKQHSKGIFTVTQLSYTFRPRRRPAKHKSTSPQYRHALKALAIRDSKIYVVDCPNLQATRAPIIYLDVEGIPSRQFYYLVGLRVCDGNLHYSTFVLGGFSRRRKTDVGRLHPGVCSG